jgi:ankyrin repeat protein
MLTNNEKKLIRAATKGLTKQAQKLLDSGTNVDVDHGRPLIRALENEHQEVIDLLLDRGARTDLGISYDFLPAAARNGRLENVKRLFEQAAKGGWIVSNYPEALVAAVEYGHRDIADLLLNRGADPDTRNLKRHEGEPLLSAVRSGHLEMVRLLLEHGAGARRRKDTLSAAIQNGNEAVIDLLRTHGASFPGPENP